MHMEPQALSITPIKKTIYSLITDGAADQRVLEALRHNAGFIPKETELWDYKRRPSGGAEFLAKSILQIVSFYNTFGGYLVFGVEEAGTNFFKAVGIETTVFNTKQLRDKLIAYTGESIDVTYVDIEYSTADNVMLFGLLHIPKRPKNTSPVYFGKSGPAVDGKLLFAKDQAYIRFQDNCIPATKRGELQLLFSDRTLQWEPDGVFPAGGATLQ